jgi:hypothetical protein
MLANCEVTPQAMWLIANSSEKVMDQRHHLEFMVPLGPIFYPIDKANLIADCLEIQFRTHDLCNCDHRRCVEAKVEALLAIVDENHQLISDPVTSQNKHNP